MRYDDLPPGMTPFLIRTAAAAAMLSVSPATLWRMVKDGIVPPPGRFGRSVFWNKSDLEAAARRIVGGKAVPAESNPDGSMKNPWDAVLRK